LGVRPEITIWRPLHSPFKTSALAKNRLASGVPFSEVVREVEDRYPYELNTMKHLEELIASIAPDQRQWELEEGNVIRAHTIWKPQRTLLQALLAQLKMLARPSSSSSFIRSLQSAREAERTEHFR
jgi:hypothetical protein